jgi:glycosyltransferase involved in cell wall biosynthesis/GT2 family glycosyltransferase
LNQQIKIAFASGPDDLNDQLVERMEALFPDLPLYVVSEFPPRQGTWIPYHISRSFRENLARCRAACTRRPIRLAGVLLVPRMPYRRMRLMALLLSPVGFLAFNENLDSFMLRPRCAAPIARHVLWRVKNFLRWQLKPGGDIYTFFWRTRHPREWRLPWLYFKAKMAGQLVAALKGILPRQRIEVDGPSFEDGISVVIPSRNGKDLLASLVPGVLRELEAGCLQTGAVQWEVIVVDNGSEDGSAEFLRKIYPEILVELRAEPLSFARAVNLGLRRARYSHVCLLNNDMLLEAGFFGELRKAFDAVPDLFCATAQILFPEGMRREETGKAVMARSGPKDFPIRCDEPLAGEDLSYVPYGSGGCSLYSTVKMRALNYLSEAYEPAYVEDLDLGYRAWLQGWPTVFVAGARVEHRHRATTSRYYTREQLDTMLEINYLRFLVRAVVSATLFRKLWRDAIWRLRLMTLDRNTAAVTALRCTRRLLMELPRPSTPVLRDELLVALGSGDVAVFPGSGARQRPVILIASPYVPYPLSHGGAVRIFNLMRRTAVHFDQVLVCFSDRLETPPSELLEQCVEVVLVRLTGSHSRPTTDRPDVVEEFDSAAYRAALRQTVRKWRPSVVQLEFTQMAQYAAESDPAPAILVEHDITFDLYQQLLEKKEDWEVRRQLEHWRRFEAEAWRHVRCVVTMSEKDRRIVVGSPAVCLPNGVDLDRFQPSAVEPDASTILFIGSFAHLPNLLALEFFVREVWPLLHGLSPRLHVIAGKRHEYYLDFYRDRVSLDLAQAGIQLEGFVADVRPAYEQAAVVIAPLTASAGTNIKVIEAMAMGKAVVSTSAGVNGLDLSPGQDVIVTANAAQMAAAISELLQNPERRRRIEVAARERVVRQYNWDAVAMRQEELYRSLRRVAEHSQVPAKS